MKRPFVLVLVLELVLDRPTWFRGRGRGRERERLGSWSQYAILESWKLPMNRTPSSRPSPPVGEKVPGGRLRGIPTGSWPRFASKFWRFLLSMNPRGTSNIEHPTPNIESQRESSLTSTFGVRSWTFDVFPRFRAQCAKYLSLLKPVATASERQPGRALQIVPLVRPRPRPVRAGR